MTEKDVTYTKEDMVKLIKLAGENIVLRRKKIFLESDIQKKSIELEYKREMLARFEKKAGTLAVQYKEALSKSTELKNLVTNCSQTRDEVSNELQHITEIEKKAAIIKERDAEIAALADSVNNLEGKLKWLRPQYQEIIARKERLEISIEDKEKRKSTLKESVSELLRKKQELLSLTPPYENVEDLAIKQAGAEKNILELKNNLNSIKEEMGVIEKEIPFYKERAASLKTEKETRDARIDYLKKAVSNINVIEDKESLVGEVKQLKERSEAARSEMAKSLSSIEALKKDNANVEASITEEENYAENFKTTARLLDAKKAELMELESEFATIEIKQEADQSVLELLIPVVEYVNGVNNALESVAKEYRDAYRHLVDTVVAGVK
ncbi:MAG: hypothetical protein HQK89_03270 [Nitrospirae bacterium]|nr:hypothetical protein [Nitrospirota bacterium]